MSERNYMEVYEQWVNNPLFGQETKDELLSIKDDPKEIEERFYCDLVFGTAGLRGIIGAGTNRMNKYVVRKAIRVFTSNTGAVICSSLSGLCSRY